MKERNRRPVMTPGPTRRDGDRDHQRLCPGRLSYVQRQSDDPDGMEPGPGMLRPHAPGVPREEQDLPGLRPAFNVPG